MVKDSKGIPHRARVCSFKKVIPKEGRDHVKVHYVDDGESTEVRVSVSKIRTHF